jgi:hypothetical protein
MEREKCIVFSFSNGKREEKTSVLFSNSQLNLDLNIEVKSSEPIYGPKILKFNKDNKSSDSRWTEKKYPDHTA